jgi:small subunit ribosomal protein S16
VALKIRLRQQGQINRPFYRIVVTDGRAPRDGKYLEAVGWYNPFESETEKGIHVDGARVQHWLGLGAQLTESAESLVLKVAPNVVRWLTDKRLAQTAKIREKSKARAKRKSQAKAS